MTNFRAQVILRTVDGILSNFVTNSWAFSTEPDGPANTTAMTTALKDFYDDVVTYLSPAIAQNGHSIKYTNLPGTPPNYPFDEDTFNLATAPAGSPLPREVSVVMSFQGLRTAGFPQNRRRGRIYLGPLDITANVSGRPDPALITMLATAGATFKSNVEAIGAGDHSWTVWSSVDGDSVQIDNGWVDNAFDTQRRRGDEATSRTTFT